MRITTATACFSSVSFAKVAPSFIVYIPKGKQSVVGSRNNKPFRLEIDANQEFAGILNAQLKQAQSDAAAGLASFPFIDFEHAGGRASALPTEFFWDEDKGICVGTEWTASGRAAIEGGDFSYFSPELNIGKDGKPCGILCPGPIGGLVNTPAFQGIGTIAAKQSTETEPQMNLILELLKQFGMELPADSDQAAICSALKPKLESAAQSASDLTTAKASLKTFEDAAAATAKAALETEADATVKAALNDGKITDAAPWKTAYLASPGTVKAQLAALPAKPDGHVGTVKTGVPGAANATFRKQLTSEEFKLLPLSEKATFRLNGGIIV
jgi:phage I-like protein